MKITFQAGAAPIFEFEASSPKEIFEKIALVQSLFSEGECGCCKSKNIKYVKRDVDNGCYLELRCNDCQAQLAFGQNKDGKGIFIKNWDKDLRQPMPNHGWFHYQKQVDSYEPAKSQPAQAAYQQPASREDIPF